MINNELLQKLREPKVQEELRKQGIFIPSTDWLWDKLIQLDVIAYPFDGGVQVSINNPLRRCDCDLMPELVFTAPTLHEALLRAWLWRREHVKEV